MSAEPAVTTFFDESTNTASHITVDPATGCCAIIDSVLGFEQASGRTNTRAADEIIEHVKSHSLSPVWILETHVHADHLSGAAYLRDQVGGKIAIGKHIEEVGQIVGKVFNLPTNRAQCSESFDRLIEDGDRLALGDLTIQAMWTPGHTPACMTYVLGDAAFVGDTLFMPDFGTARTDFPGGDAGELYRSIQKILALPESTRLFLCHDYKAPGRDEFRWETTVAEQRDANIHLRDGVTEEAFVGFREARDKTLKMPALMLSSVQVNICAGQLPPAECNDIRYLKIPLDAL